MMGVEIEHHAASCLSTFGGIPIRNVWHMLLYSWDLSAYVNRWDSEAEEAPNLDSLLAMILASVLEQRLRIGVGRGYRNDEGTIRGVRGRIDFGSSIKRLSFQKCEAACRFQTFDHDVARNQIIRSVIAELARTGSFDWRINKTAGLRLRLRRLARSLEGVALVRVNPTMISREIVVTRERDYKLMLHVCSLIVQTKIPVDEMPGRHTRPSINHEKTRLFDVFEKFVARFFQQKLTGWKVAIQPRLRWDTEATSEYLPLLKPDLVLTSLSGSKLIIDTKFTANSLKDNGYGQVRFDSQHLYQLYTYLRTQEHLSVHDRSARGMLLYPFVGTGLDEHLQMQAHEIRIRTIDLSRPWQDVENELISLVAYFR